MCGPLCLFTGLFSYVSVNIVTNTSCFWIHSTVEMMSVTWCYKSEICVGLFVYLYDSFHMYRFLLRSFESLSWCYTSEICVRLFVYVQVSFRIYRSMLSHTHLLFRIHSTVKKISVSWCYISEICIGLFVHL